MQDIYWILVFQLQLKVLDLFYESINDLALGLLKDCLLHRVAIFLLGAELGGENV